MIKKIISSSFIILLSFVTSPLGSCPKPINYSSTHINIDNRRFNVSVAKVDPRQTKIKIALSGERLNRLKSLSNIESNNNGIRINGSYFKPSDGLPVGLVVKDGEIITSPYPNRVCFGMDNNNKPIIGIPNLEGNLRINNKDLQIYHINQPVFDCKGVTLLTDRYGVSIPRLNKNFKYILIKDNKVISISTNYVTVSKGYSLAIASRFPKDIKVGDDISIRYNLNNNFKGVRQAVGGGTYLVKDNQIYVDYKNEKFSSSFVSAVRPRTAIGYDRYGHVIMVVIGSSSVFDEAKIMKKLGCVNAINLDGGSSTQMIAFHNHIGSNRGISTAVVVN